jgi:hypothetical protein
MHDYESLLIGTIFLAITFSSTLIYIKWKESKKH